LERERGYQKGTYRGGGIKITVNTRGKVTTKACSTRDVVRKMLQRQFW